MQQVDRHFPSISIHYKTYHSQYWVSFYVVPVSSLGLQWGLLYPVWIKMHQALDSCSLQGQLVATIH